jgi:uncharacterized membrane protein YedE/YeeE
MTFLAYLVSGLLLGTGLVVSGMIDPMKVLNFLDFAAIATGGWDASLAFVLGGAVIVAFIGYRLVLARPRPLFADRFDLPTARTLDARLIGGAAIFGIGWGLVGFCPGPALASLGLAAPGMLVFLPAMFLGMFVARRLIAGRQTPMSVAAGPARAGR